MVNIRAGEAVSIKHYSNSSSPLKSVVMDVSKDFIEIKITKDIASLNCFEGDSIVLGYEQDRSAYLISCNVWEINPLAGTIKLRVDNIEVIINQRTQERYIVSLYGDVRTKHLRNKYTISVKDLSLNGMMICTKADFPIDGQLEVDLYLGNTVVFMNANIVWKLQDHYNFRYGLKTECMTEQDKHVLTQYIGRLKNEQQELLDKLRNEK